MTDDEILAEYEATIGQLALENVSLRGIVAGVRCGVDMMMTKIAEWTALHPPAPLRVLQGIVRTALDGCEDVPAEARTGPVEPPAETGAPSGDEPKSAVYLGPALRSFFFWMHNEAHGPAPRLAAGYTLVMVQQPSSGAGAGSGGGSINAEPLYAADLMMTPSRHEIALLVDVARLRGIPDTFLARCTVARVATLEGAMPVLAESARRDRERRTG